MTPFEKTAPEMVLDERTPAGLGGRWYGVYPALVTDIKDPDGLGRVRVTLPWVVDPEGGRYEAWARLATMMGGKNRGSWFVPDVDDEVLVAFEAGEPRRPYVVGCLWNGRDTPPESMDGAGNNHRKVICSRSGLKITLDDSTGRENVLIETPGGQKVKLQDGLGSVEVADSAGNSLKLEPTGVTITASARVAIQAAQMEITVGQLSVNAGMSQFAGMVQAMAVNSPSVISATYTPGLGDTLGL